MSMFLNKRIYVYGDFMGIIIYGLNGTGKSTLGKDLRK